MAHHNPQHCAVDCTGPSTFLDNIYFLTMFVYFYWLSDRLSVGITHRILLILILRFRGIIFESHAIVAAGKSQNIIS